VNLLVNSIQAITYASDEEGRVELTTAVEDDVAVLEVRDSEPGIPAEYLDRIFEGFFTTKEEGIGIGLAICQSILLAHNGSISVSNHANGGVHFRVSLPLVK